MIKLKKFILQKKFIKKERYFNGNKNGKHWNNTGREA